MNNGNNIAPILLSLTQEQVAFIDQENTDGESWEYYCNGNVLHATVLHNEINSIVHEYFEYFKVNIKINEQEMYCSCTCNSEHIICKHVVALLYSWVYDKEEFINIRSFIRKLKQANKDLLIDMIERLLKNDPRNIKFFKEQNDSELSDLEIDSLNMA